MPLEVFFDDAALLALTGETDTASWMNNDPAQPTLLTPSTGSSNLQAAESQPSNDETLFPSSSSRGDTLSTESEPVAPHSPTQLDVSVEVATDL